jgi:hypothetical protein
MMRPRRPKPKGKFTSDYFGVSRHPRGLWVVKLHAVGGRSHLGYFQSEEEAALAYDDTAAFVLGSAASLNFPDRVRPTLVYMDEA